MFLVGSCFKKVWKWWNYFEQEQLISILCNVKLWLNYWAVTQLFTPVRSNALRYMCELTDMDLRQQPARHIADFLWSSIKENVDGTPPIAFDRDGLELAFKYFCSTTLTMRLAGITQINSHISLFNEMCNAGKFSTYSIFSKKLCKEFQ